MSDAIASVVTCAPEGLRRRYAFGCPSAETILALLVRGRFNEAIAELERIPPTAHDREYLAATAAHWAHLHRNAHYQDPATECEALTRIAVLWPDERALLQRLISLTNDTDESRTTWAIGLLAAAPTPFLARKVEGWRSSFDEFASGGAANARKLMRRAVRLAAAGALDDQALGVMLSAEIAARADLAGYSRLAAFAGRKVPPERLNSILERAGSEFTEGRMEDALHLCIVALHFALSEQAVSLVLDAMGAMPRVPDAWFDELVIVPRLQTGEHAKAAAGWLDGALSEAIGRGETERALLSARIMASLGLVQPASSLRAMELLTNDLRAEQLVESLVSAVACDTTLAAQLDRCAETWRAGVATAYASRDHGRTWAYARWLIAARALDEASAETVLRSLGRREEDGELLRDWLRLSRALPDGTATAPMKSTAKRVARHVGTVLRRGAPDPVTLVDILVELVRRNGLSLNELELLATNIVDGGTEDAVRACLVHHPGDRRAEAAFVLGFLDLAGARQYHARQCFQTALKLGLQGELARGAASEIQAATFTRVGGDNRPGEPALTFIEREAMSDLIAAAREVASHLFISAPHDLPPDMFFQDGQGADATVETVPYRILGLEGAQSDALHVSDWLAAEFEVLWKRLVPQSTISDAFADGFRKHLFGRLYPRLRQIFNLIDALETTGAQRLFLIAATQGFAATATELIRARFPSHEVCVASAAQRGRNRRALAAAEPGDIASIESVDPPTDISVDPTVGGLPQANAPHLDQANPPGFIASFKRRPFELAALVDLIVRLSAHWRLVVVYIDPEGGGEDLLEMLAAHAGYRGDRIDVWIVKTHQLHDAVRANIQALKQSITQALDTGRAPRVFGDVGIGHELTAALPKLVSEFCVTLNIETWFEQQLRILRPAFMLVPHSTNFENFIMCATARRLDVPTYWLQLLQHRRDETFWRPPAAHHLVIDHYSRQLWHEHIKVDERDITVVGSLHLQLSLARVREVDRGSVVAELGMPRDHRYVLVATQPVALEENLDLVRVSARAIAPLEDVHIVIKLHPNEPASRVEAIAAVLAEQGMLSRSLVTRTIDVYKLIRGSELVVVQHSNVGIEATLMDKPVVSLLTGAKTQSFSLSDHGFTDEIRDLAEGEDRIRTLLTDPDFRKRFDLKRQGYLAANIHLHDGRVVDRILAAIEAGSRRSRPAAPDPLFAAATRSRSGST